LSQGVQTTHAQLTLPVKLAPTAEQTRALLGTIERFNAACDWIGGVALRERCANKVALQKLVYYEVRARFGLAAQLSIRAISKVVEAYKRDRTSRPRFRPRGAVPHDERIMSWKGVERISLLTLEGWAIVPVVLAPYQAARIDRGRGQADLVYRDGDFYLYVTWTCPNPSRPRCPTTWASTWASSTRQQTRTGTPIRARRSSRSGAPMPIAAATCNASRPVPPDASCVPCVGGKRASRRTSTTSSARLS
jgi:predicted transposase